MPQNERLKEEINFGELRQKPSKLFAYVYIYFLAALVLLGLLYVWNMTSTGKNAITPAALADSSAFVRDIPYTSPRQIPPVDVMEVSRPAPELISRGRDLYQANCASCHGNTGEGDGPAGMVMNPKPRNFHQSEGWTNGRKISEIYRTLEEGIVKNGMASFNYIPPADRFALAHFTRTFMQNPPEDSRDDLMALEASYQLSKGTSTAGTIPVRRATALLSRENAPKEEQAERAGILFTETRGSAGAAVLSRVMTNEDRALYCLVVEGVPDRTLDEFVKTLCSDPQSLGLRADVARLSSEEWSELYRLVQQLKSQLAQEDRRRG